MYSKIWFSILAWILLCTVSGNSMAQDFLTLEESIAAAKELNLGIDVEEQNIYKRSVDIKKARADMLPVLSLNSDYEHLPGIHTLKDSVDLSWDLSSLVKNSGKPQDLMLKAAEKKKFMVETLLVYRVKALYYKLMQSKQKLIILQKGRDLLNRQRSITQQFVSSGLRLTSALFRVDDQINTIQDKIFQQQGAIDQARSALLQLINLADPAGIKFIDCKKEFIPLPDRSLVMEKAMKKAPEIQRMIFEQQALAESVHRPWMDMLPVVSVSAGYQQEWPDSKGGYDFHMMVSIPFPVMERTKYVHAANAALAAKKQAEIRQKIKDISDCISILYEKAELNKILFTAYKKNHTHRLQTLRLIEREYESGLISESEFINTQRDTIDAAFKMGNVFYDYMMLAAEIDYCQGAVE